MHVCVCVCTPTFVQRWVCVKRSLCVYTGDCMSVSDDAWVCTCD